MIVDILRENLLTFKYSTAVSSNGFEICGKEATSIMDHSKTCLDHFLSKTFLITIYK